MITSAHVRHSEHDYVQYVRDLNGVKQISIESGEGGETLVVTVQEEDMSSYNLCYPMHSVISWKVKLREHKTEA